MLNHISFFFQTRINEGVNMKNVSNNEYCYFTKITITSKNK